MKGFVLLLALELLPVLSRGIESDTPQSLYLPGITVSATVNAYTPLAPIVISTGSPISAEVPGGGV
jgi:hypothetical protein